MEIPFGPNDVACIRINQRRWNFRGWLDSTLASRSRNFFSDAACRDLAAKLETFGLLD